MLLQTNSYVVPARQRAEHARLLGRFRKALARVGCDSFEIYEQADAKWDSLPGDARFVQIIRFRDRQHQLAVREAERLDLEAQSLIEEFCQLINFPYQHEHGLFAVGFYNEMKDALEAPAGPKGDAVEQDLDDWMGEFGDPRVLLAVEDMDAVAEAEPSLRIMPPQERSTEPSCPQRSPPADEKLDELLETRLSPTGPCDAEPTPGDSDLARVLDAGLAFDDLDTPMEAELLDEPALDEPAVEVPPPSPRRVIR